VKVSDFDYDLPEALIAQEPLERRDESRLLVLHRGQGTEHHRFSELPELLRPGDLLVLNNTRVLPARFYCRRETGGRIEGLYLEASEDGTWNVLLRNASRCGSGEVLAFEGHDRQRLKIVERLGGGTWRVQPLPKADPAELLEAVGIMPLPPYIRRNGEDRPADRQRYQTVYASRAGAVAAPTAGLHFTDELLERLADREIGTAHVTLHVGPGTFAPVKVEDVVDHDMHSETYELTAEAAEAIMAARQAGRRIVAVGTTSVRVLETIAGRHGGSLVPAQGSTRLFLYPPATFHIVDALVTNFHLPKSTLLMLVAALCDPGGFAGREMVLSAYREAVEQRYRFYSYGDAMLID
jgi:S-adenosylmethionine:tRNA ribosyltransferase-isomerase